MSALVADIVGGVGFVLLLVMVHEYGHYGVGRLFGVPADSMRVELGANPPHVGLREGGRWVSPMDDEYAEIFQRRCPGTWQAWSYIAGGVLLEATFALAVALAGVKVAPVVVVAAGV